VNGRQTAYYDVVFYFDMPRRSAAVGNNYIVSDYAVMRDMA
jgi:hypothetical protein